MWCNPIHQHNANILMKEKCPYCNSVMRLEKIVGRKPSTIEKEWAPV